MSKFIDPLTDVGFKRIFGNKEIMINFLNSLFEGEFVICDLDYLDKEMESLPGDERNIIYDLFCRTDNGMEFIVEMQRRSQIFYRDRIVYYISRAIAGQGVKGKEWNYKLTPVYGVYLMNFGLSDDGNVIDDISLYSKTQIKSGVDAKPFSDKFRAITIDMHSFNKNEMNCETTIDQWIYNIRNMERTNKIAFKEKNEIFEQLETLSDYYAMDPEDRKLYDTMLRRSRDYYATLEYERVEGLQQGIQQGMQQGAEQKNLENARSMKQLNVDAQIIAQVTGLSLEEIEKL